MRTANPNVRFLPCTAYLDGVIEDQGVKLCQVLHVVALDYVVVLSHQASQLLHVEEQLCHLAGGKREEGETKIVRLPVRNLLTWRLRWTAHAAFQNRQAYWQLRKFLHCNKPFIIYLFIYDNLPVNVIINHLQLWYILSVPDKPHDLIPGKWQSHKDKESLEQTRNIGNYSQSDSTWRDTFQMIKNIYIYIYYLASTFGPRSPGSSSINLTSSASAPLKNCLLSLCMAPLGKTRSINLGTLALTGLSTAQRCLIFGVETSPVGQSVIAALLDVCYALAVSGNWTTLQGSWRGCWNWRTSREWCGTGVNF